jgi:flavin-dependent dehydrogenase
MSDVDVLIVGAGPVGLTLAIDLAWRASRPDQHVAWRGERLPPDPAQLIDRVRDAG